MPQAEYQGLTTVAGLREGRTEAREKLPVGPVADEVVERTLPLLSPTVTTMVRVQRLSGMRPQEVILMRAREGAETLVRAWKRDGHYQSFQFGSRPVPFKEDRDQLILLADRALAATNPFRAFYDAGVAIGEYSVKLFDQEPDPAGETGFGRLPEIRTLVDCVCALPRDFLEEIPLLRGITLMKPLLDSEGQTAFFEAVIAQSIERELASRDFGCSYRARDLIDAINDQLEDSLDSQNVDDGLSGTSPEVFAGSPEDPSPVRSEGTLQVQSTHPPKGESARGRKLDGVLWNPLQRRLFYNGELVLVCGV